MNTPIKVLKKGEKPKLLPPNSFQLQPDNWDDYSYKTSFYLHYSNANAQPSVLGTLKIGYRDQPTGWTHDALSDAIDYLPDGWFSLGQDVDYYRNIREQLPQEVGDQLLKCLCDVVSNEILFNQAKDEHVFRTSLLRGVSLSVIHGQFARVLQGNPVLTNFKFDYRSDGDEKHAPVNLCFRVEPASKPPTNIHVLIGRNGVGKTTILNNMVAAALDQPNFPATRGSFFEIDRWDDAAPLKADYFSSVVSVSFSAFDPFVPPTDQPDRSRGLAYFYIGLKNARTGETPDPHEPDPPKTEIDLADELLNSLDYCLSQPEKRKRWLSAIKRLESDSNFEDMRLARLVELDATQARPLAASLVSRMSSGHAIVLLTITRLVETVEEKTLVLMDEPESHLHPPLLSAFTRALSDLLHDRNGVAIIATHSPVLVQEVPRNCVWKLTRSRAYGRADRPERETFGENVGVLTRDIFGLEVSRSGYHDLLQREVAAGGTFESILAAYRNRLGIEAQGILRTLISARDTSAE